MFRLTACFHYLKSSLDAWCKRSCVCLALSTTCTLNRPRQYLAGQSAVIAILFQYKSFKVSQTNPRTLNLKVAGLGCWCEPHQPMSTTITTYMTTRFSMVGSIYIVVFTGMLRPHLQDFVPNPSNVALVWGINQPSICMVILETFLPDPIRVRCVKRPEDYILFSSGDAVALL
jgi:hypothetical protein